MLNNCRDQQVYKNLNNEFEYPPMVLFYKSKAAEFVKVVPNTFTIGLYDFFLGECDMTKKAVPFVDTSRRERTIVLNNVLPTYAGLAPCSTRVKMACEPAAFLKYMVTFKESLDQLRPV